MTGIGIDRRRALSLAGIAWVAGNALAHAQGQPDPPAPPGQRPDNAASERPRLPPAATTHHALELPGRTLQFQATAGGIVVADERRGLRAELGFVAFQLDGADRARRPVTFVFNGGPGFASAWLNVGAVGPWRVAIGGEGAGPSAPAEPLPNAETWLDFTDLVFIDPVGTGYSRVLTGDDDVRRRLWSVDGDIEYLAEAIRRWLDRFERNVSPKYLLGESYGGFRVPRLARALAETQSTGVSGLVLLSPALDFGGRSTAFDPLIHVARLPTMAATMRAEQGPVTRAELADVEHYARTEFLTDVLRGEGDPEAIARRSARVAELTGLDPALVRRYHGLIVPRVFLHELERQRGRVGSIYDATVTAADPFPLDPMSDYPDPVLDGLKAPVGSAMVAICETRLNWRPDRPYQLGNDAAPRQWDWNYKIWSPPQAVDALRTALSLDSRLSVLITHGLFDLITPYLSTQILLDQLPPSGLGDRVRFSVHPGGHMFYSDNDSRVALSREAAALYAQRV
jgi:carboxypeptidase C (cathepsin A)